MAILVTINPPCWWRRGQNSRPRRVSRVKDRHAGPLAAMLAPEKAWKIVRGPYKAPGTISWDKAPYGSAVRVYEAVKQPERPRVVETRVSVGG